MGKPGWWGAIALVALALGAGSAGAGPELEAAKALMDGRTKLEALSRALRDRRAETSDLIDAVEAAIASDEALRRALERVAPAARQVREDAEEFHRAAEKQFLKAFVLERVGRAPRQNVREPVNIKAAEALGATGRRRASEGLVRALDGSIFKRKSVVTPELLSTAFNALATLGHVESLEWMIREFTHSKSSPPREVDRLVAAHAAMARFDLEAIPGRVRLELVDRMLRTYEPYERMVARLEVSVSREFWVRVRPGALAAVQVFAGHPRDAAGRPLDTMWELREWLDADRNRRRR